MAHPSAAGAAVLVNGPLDSVGSPMLFQAPGSLFYPILDELPSIAHPVEIFSTRQESLTSYKDRSQLGTCSFSIFGTTSSSPVSSSSSHNTSPGYTRLALSRSYRRVRRKETTRADAPDSQNPGEKQYPLYCSICRVTLNAQIQARQHYNGKQHGRRLRMISRGRSEGGQQEVKATSNLELLGESMTTDWTGNQNPESGVTAEVEEDELTSIIGISRPEVDRTDVTRRMHGFEGISCDIYCTVCAVSFNSATQARQHYQGKSHARRLRTTSVGGRQPGGRQPRSPPERKCLNNFSTKQKDAFYTCLICDSRPTLSSSRNGNREALPLIPSGLKKLCTAQPLNGTRLLAKVAILRYDVPLSMIVYTHLLCSVEIEAMEVSETQKQALSEITSYASRTLPR